MWSVISTNVAGGILVVCASHKTAVLVDATSNTPTNIRSASFRANPHDLARRVSVYMDDLQPRKTFENLIALKDKTSSTMTDGTVHAL